jgi:6-pyruvoyl-tetrahydropterin synthase
MLLRLTLRRTFVADHFHDLPGFREDRHGHNWDVEASVDIEGLDQEHRLASVLQEWTKQVNYTLLNDQSVLQGTNPTTEALAHWAFSFLEDHGLLPVQVKVREKANYWAACRRAEAP